MTTFIHPFTFGDRTQSDLLGGKGANLAEMVKIGLPVPPGFTITTEACREFLVNEKIPEALPAQLEAALANLEKELGKRVRQSSKTTFSFSPLWCKVFNAGNDGDRSKRWNDARSCTSNGRAIR